MKNYKVILPPNYILGYVFANFVCLPAYLSVFSIINLWIGMGIWYMCSYICIELSQLMHHCAFSEINK